MPMALNYKSLFMGYDIGGTKIELVLLNSNHEILFQKRAPTDRDRGYQHVLTVIKSLFDECLNDQKISAENISSIGLALPGMVDPETEMMMLGNTHVLEEKPLKTDILNTLNINIPIRAENDANCFALAECHLGAGKDFSTKNMVGIILGTGVGGGIVIHGKAYSGKRGSAGEIGHLFLNPPEGQASEQCYCGQWDCAELYLSGTGLQKAYLKETGEQASASIILKNQKFLDLYRKNLGKFLGRLANTLDPEYFVIGGGVSKSDVIYEGLTEHMLPHLFYKKNPPKILKHKISDSAGSIGAALLGQFP